MNAMWTMGGNRSIIPFTHTANRPSWLPQYAYSRFRLERTQSSWVFPYEFQMKQHFNDFIRWSAWVVQCDNLDSPNEGTSCQMRQCPRVSAGVSGVAGRLKVTRLSPWFIQSNVSLDIITYPIWAMFISAIYIYKHMYVYIYSIYIYISTVYLHTQMSPNHNYHSPTRIMRGRFKSKSTHSHHYIHSHVFPGRFLWTSTKLRWIGLQWVSPFSTKHHATWAWKNRSWRCWEKRWRHEVGFLSQNQVFQSAMKSEKMLKLFCKRQHRKRFF